MSHQRDECQQLGVENKRLAQIFIYSLEIYVIPPDAAGPGEVGASPFPEDPSRAVAPPVTEYDFKSVYSQTRVHLNSPNKTRRAFERSPSGPAIEVRVWPQRGPGAAPDIGNERGLGTGRGLDISPSILF